MISMRRPKTLLLALTVGFLCVAADGCRKFTPPPAKPKPKRPRRVRRPRPRPAPTPASKPALVPASKPAPPPPWKTVRKITPEESFAFFRKLHEVSTLRVPKVAKAPEIDGKLDEAYKLATPLRLRFLDGRRAQPTAATTVHVVSTDKELFVFYECLSPDMGALRATVKEHDRDVWQDDSVEMFLDPGDRREMTTYHHIVVNPLGTTMDVKSPKTRPDLKWNPDLRVKTHVGPKGWTVELALPFADLAGQARSTHRVWAANFNRMARLPKGQEDTAWCPTGSGDSHIPAYFGLMWLDAGDVYEDYARWTGPRRTFAVPPEPAFRFKPAAPDELAKCPKLTANADKTAWFGPGTQADNVEVLYILADDRAFRVSSLHGWRPLNARWLNAKLLYIWRDQTESNGYYCIYDVHRRTVLVEEAYNDGTAKWQEISEKLKAPK